MPDRKKLTKTQRMHWMYAVDARRMIEHDLHDYLAEQTMLPQAWNEIWEEKDRRDVNKTRVTIALDADVVKFFKTMGPGYQPRMNRVLRAFMHYRLAGLIAGPDTTDYVLRPEAVAGKSERAEWGDYAKFHERLNGG